MLCILNNFQNFQEAIFKKKKNFVAHVTWVTEQIRIAATC